MTDTSQPRCLVDVGPLHAKVVIFRPGEDGLYACDLPLVRAESGPCETCGRERGAVEGCHWPDGLRYHPYLGPLVCSVHGGQP